MKRIVYIQRKTVSGFYSIESVFDNLKEDISNKLNTSTYTVTTKEASPWSMLKNITAFKYNKKEVYHITGDVHYMALATRKSTVLTIHDVGSALKGSILKQLYIKLFWFWLPAMLVKQITVISEFTKVELVKLIPFAKNKIQVIPNTVNDGFRFVEYKFKKDCPTLLCVGTKTNKNLIRVINALSGLNCHLHIIGQLSIEQVELLDKYSIKYSNEINLSQNEIIKAYQNCDILCFPSTYEGFGMPIIEAQATGRPVLTSNLGSMKEVARDSACLVNPYSEKSISSGLSKIINDKAYRQSLIQKGLENQKRFDSRNVAEQYINIYKDL